MLSVDAALAGIYVLRRVDGDVLDRVVKGAIRTYRGPSFGGLDLMAPNEAREAWLLIGRWTDCFLPDVQQAARTLLDALRVAADLEYAGVQVHDGGDVVVNTTQAFAATERTPGVEVSPLVAYRGRMAMAWEEGTARAEFEALFPMLPAHVGMHMGAPHWLGHGLRREGDRIVSVTPYVRLDFAPGELRVSAMCEQAAFDGWLEAFTNATK